MSALPSKADMYDATGDVRKKKKASSVGAGHLGFGAQLKAAELCKSSDSSLSPRLGVP